MNGKTDSISLFGLPDLKTRFHELVEEMNQLSPSRCVPAGDDIPTDMTSLFPQLPSYTDMDRYLKCVQWCKFEEGEHFKKFSNCIDDLNKGDVTRVMLRKHVCH